jgi:hypothetical protein
MSVDFNAIMEVTRMGVPVGEWPQLMRGLGPRTDAVIQRWRQRWQPQEWTAESDAEVAGFVRILGPGGFAIILSPVAAQVYHCSRWDRFVKDEEHQRLLRGACLEVSQVLGSSRAVYMPELTPHPFFEGKGLPDIEADLRSNFAEPPPSIGEVGERFEAHCYWIDRFADLRGESC